MKKAIILLVLFLVGIAGATFFLNQSKLLSQSNQKAPQPPFAAKVKVGYMPFTSNWVMFLALEKGMFKDEGLDVEPVVFTSGTDAANALAQGDIAAHAINTYTDLLNVESRAPGTFKLLIVQQSTNKATNEALIVKKSSTIVSIKQLTGKKIGVTPGIFTEAVLKKAYEKEINFTTGTQIVKLPPQSQLAALESGQIDALVAYEPAITIGLENGSTRILDDHPWKRVQEPFPVGGYTLSTKYMTQNPEITKKIAKALLRALDYGTNNPGEVIKATAKFTNLSEDLVGKLRWNENISVANLPQNYFADVANLYFNLGQIDKKVDAINFGYSN